MAPARSQPEKPVYLSTEAGFSQELLWFSPNMRLTRADGVSTLPWSLQENPVTSEWE
jgi:hypothetical protein